jgi:hypothetical protein
MGYTHYFAYDPNAESFVSAWPRMVSDAVLTNALAALGSPLPKGPAATCGPPPSHGRTLRVRSAGTAPHAAQPTTEGTGI